MKSSLVNWYEGMLLLPQHLQYNDQYWNQNLMDLGQFFPNFWGVYNLDFDQFNLIQGNVVLNSGHVIFPNGEKFCFLENYSIESLKLEPNQSTSITVFLAIENSEITEKMYLNTKTNVANLHNRLSVESIETIQRKIFLVQEKDLRGFYSSIPVIKIRCLGTSFQREDFIPPSIRISKKTVFYDQLIQLLQNIKEYLFFLLSYKNKNSYLENLNRMFSQIAPEISILQNLLITESHPFNIFQSLSKINSVLSYYLESCGSSFEYNHTKLNDVMTDLLKNVVRLVNKIQIRNNINEFTIMTVSRQETFLDTQEQKIEILLFVENTRDVSRAFDSIHNLQIFSKDLEDQIKINRLIGAQREIISNVESSLVDKTILFSVNLDDQWIKNKSTLVITGPEIGKYILGIKK